MAGYTKLFGSILDSTVWQTPGHVRLVWITMLAMADRDGVVEASVPGLAIRAGVERLQADQALALLMAPDPDSRNPAHDGRRVEKVDGGWRLLNYAAYLHKLSADDRREKEAARKRRYRADKAGQSANVPLVPPGPAPVHTETETETETDPPTPFGGVVRGFAERLHRHGGVWTGLGKYTPEAELAAAAYAGRPADLERSLDGFFADAWAREKGYPFGAWVRNPSKYAPAVSAEQSVETFEQAAERVRLANEARRKARSA